TDRVLVGCEHGGVLDTSARLLRVLSLLQARPSWTANELAERLAVTTRTVRRDMARLRQLGYPVESEPGPDGGYRLGRGGRLPPLLLDDDEAVAVAIGLRLAADGSVTGLDEATVAALAKLDQVLPAPLAERVRGVHDAVVDLQGRAPDRVGGDVFLTLAQACRQGLRLRFGYTDRHGVASERRVDPLRLVRSGPRWYLVCHDLDRQAWRTLRVDRIDEVHVTKQRVDLDDPPDAVELVTRATGVEPYPLQARVRLPMGQDEAARAFSRAWGVHEPDGEDATVVTFGGPDLDRAVRWLSSL